MTHTQTHTHTRARARPDTHRHIYTPCSGMWLPYDVTHRCEDPRARVCVCVCVCVCLRCTLPRNVFKYWLQRYSLFSKFDDGIEVSTYIHTQTHADTHADTDADTHSQADTHSLKESPEQ